MTCSSNYFMSLWILLTCTHLNCYGYIFTSHPQKLPLKTPNPQFLNSLLCSLFLKELSLGSDNASSRRTTWVSGTMLCLHTFLNFQGLTAKCQEVCMLLTQWFSFFGFSWKRSGKMPPSLMTSRVRIC